MRHVGNLVGQCAILVTRGNLQQAILKAFVGEVLRILRVHHADTIDDEAVGIHVRGSRTKGHCPQSVGATRHVLTSSKLHVDLNVLGVLILVLEGYCPVSIRAGLCHHCHWQQGKQGKQGQFFHSLILCLLCYCVLLILVNEELAHIRGLSVLLVQLEAHEVGLLCSARLPAQIRGDR